MRYQPKPIVAEEIVLPQSIHELIERLAENAHDVWAKQRISEGWQHGPERNDARKEHPCLVAYADLPESEKQYDRNAATSTLKAIIALGYRIEKAS